MKRTTRALTTTAIAAGLLLPTGVLATAAPAVAEEDPGPLCQVTGGELTWGVKERFRSYISGTIANGEWTVSDGAGYETPEFIFGEAEGEIDANTGEGSVALSGAVNFTGHGGVLDLTISNPTIEFGGDGTARLLLDTSSNNAEGELVVDETQVFFGKIADTGEVDPTTGSVTLDGVETILTAEGAQAFSDFYATGENLDPITLNLELGPCAADAGAEAAPEETETDVEPVAAEEAEIPWLPIGIGAVALAVIAVTLTLLITGRKKPGNADDGADSSAEEDLTEN